MSWRKSLRKHKANMRGKLKIQKYNRRINEENRKTQQEAREFYGNDVWIPSKLN